MSYINICESDSKEGARKEQDKNPPTNNQNKTTE